MSKELDKLIEQVLAEKITNNLVSPSVDLYTKKGKSKPPRGKGPDNTANWADVGVKSNIQDRSIEFQHLAGSVKPYNELTDEDLEAAIKDMVRREQEGKSFGKNTREYKRDQAISSMRTKGSPEVQEKVNSMILQVVRDQLSPEDPDAQEKLKQLTTKITSYIDRLEDQRVSAFAPQQLPPRSLETTEDVFEKGTMPKASPYLVDLFSGIDGDSIQAKLKSISDFSQAAQNNELQAWASGKDEFSPFIYGKVLTFLADLIKRTGSTEAGFEFERWLALLLNLPVAGAEKGAADNLGKIGADTVYTSAKLYKTITGEYSPSQNEAGLKKTTSGGNKIYYFIGHKQLGGAKGEPIQGFHFIDAIDLYLVEVSQNENGELEGRFVYDNATKRSDPWILSTKEDKGTQRILTPQSGPISSEIEAFKFATIYLPQGEITNNQLQTTAELLADRVNKIQDSPITKAVMDAATSIKRMEANTDSYVGKSKQKKGSATSYIDEITKDYRGLRDLYNQIFSYGEKGPDRESSELYLENPKSPLDQLIEAIVKEKLLK